MVGDKKNFFGTTCGKHYPGKEIFQSMALYNTHKLGGDTCKLIINLVGIWNRNN